MDKEGGRRKLRLELIVLFERSTDADDPERRQAQRDPAKRYHAMTGVGPEVEFSADEFEEMLNNAAVAGYHMLAASPMGFPEMVVIVERNPPGAARYSYRVLMTGRTSTLKKELLEAAAAGWLPHPRGRLDTGGTAEGGAGEIVLVTERIQGSVPDPTEYELLAATRTSTLSKELSQAAGAGFQVVTAGSGRGEVVVVLKRARARPERSRGTR